MTNLGGKVIERTKNNEIVMRVSGDLSHEYALVPLGQTNNVGLGFGTKAALNRFLQKHGSASWHKQVAEYGKHTRITENEYDDIEAYRGKFGYLPPEIAKEYVGENETEGAYGDYAEEIRKKYRIGKYAVKRERERINKLGLSPDAPYWKSRAGKSELRTARKLENDQGQGGWFKQRRRHALAARKRRR